jgi:hypothetical protein
VPLPRIFWHLWSVVVLAGRHLPGIDTTNQFNHWRTVVDQVAEKPDGYWIRMLQRNPTMLARHFPDPLFDEGHIGMLRDAIGLDGC